jgi:hypothetical protein
MIWRSWWIWTAALIALTGRTLHRPVTTIDRHDTWFFWVIGAAFMVAAKWSGRQLAEGLREPDDTPHQLAARGRWHAVAWFAIGLASAAYGAWLWLGL